ncbi:MAG TPA: 50S ribosomal protein L9 [Actinomycetes bacterium]
MKLILTQEVSGLGAPGDLVEVKDGYGRNYLLPRRLAMPWTRGAEKQIASFKRAREIREVADAGQARRLKAELEALSVTIVARAGEAGRLFGSITVADVVDAVKAAGGPTIDKRSIELPGQIKSLGSHTVRVKLHPEVSAAVSLDVVSA